LQIPRRSLENCVSKTVNGCVEHPTEYSMGQVYSPRCGR
jgi:hypothetical protein